MDENSLFLTVQQGPNSGMSYPLPQSGVVTIGRHSENSITIEHPAISRRHAQLSIQNGHVALSDLGSANGTWVNGSRITGVVNVRPGDRIGLGDEILFTLVGGELDSDKTIVNAPAVMAKSIAPPVVSQPRQMASPPPPQQNSGKIWLIGAMLFVALIALVLAAVLGFSLLNKPSSPTAESVAIVVTDTPVPTNTPYPTYTPYPTQAPTQTPYPTYTPFPTKAPTQTPYPTYTPFPTQAPTQTPYPTYTPFPTKKPPTATARVIYAATATKKPTATTAPRLFSITLGNNVHYEPWGQPLDANGCSGPYNDYVQMKRFYLQVLLTNNSSATIDEDWYPRFTSANGADIPSCVYRYDNLIASPGETVDVTYVTYLQPNDYVTRASFWIFKDVETICFNSAGASITCPY